MSNANLAAMTTFEAIIALNENAPGTITEVSHERAFDLVGELENKVEKDFTSAQTFKGLHPVLGWIYVIIQAFGGALILPFVFQAS